MVQVVPLYLVNIENDKESHLCVGEKLNTLCDKKSISSAVQVDDINKSDNIDEDLCEECYESWNEIRQHVRVESVISCDRCRNTYSEQKSRALIDSNTQQKVPLCKPCYEDIYSNSSSVETPYEDAEPWFNYSGDRTFEIPEKAQN